jgi:hypothetical protein
MRSNFTAVDWRHGKKKLHGVSVGARLLTTPKGGQVLLYIAFEPCCTFMHSLRCRDTNSALLIQPVPPWALDLGFSTVR